MNVSIHYLHFCNVISHGPATDCVATIAMVMKLSGGTTDPNQIAVWWNQWQALKQAMKENHPMVKLAAALCPADPGMPVVVAEEPAPMKKGKGCEICQFTGKKLVEAMPGAFKKYGPDPCPLCSSPAEQPHALDPVARAFIEDDVISRDPTTN